MSRVASPLNCPPRNDSDSHSCRASVNVVDVLNGDPAGELYTPFGADGPSAGNDASSQDSPADSHDTHRNWISECLWWLASCRRSRYQSDYVVLLVNGSERFGANSCLLSGKDPLTGGSRGCVCSFVWPRVYVPVPFLEFAADSHVWMRTRPSAPIRLRPYRRLGYGVGPADTAPMV